MENERYVWVAAIVLVVSCFFGFLIFATDVFAQEDLTEEGASNIVNVYMDNIKAKYPGESANIQVGKPQKVKVDGKTVWRVKITYTGKNTALATIFTGDGYFTIPIKYDKKANGQYIYIIKFNGKTYEITTGKKGLGTVLLPAPLLSQGGTSTTNSGNTANTPSTTSTDSRTSSDSSSSSDVPVCPQCGGTGVHCDECGSSDHGTCSYCAGAGYLYSN